MFLPNPGVLAAGDFIAPPGQQLFTTSGTFITPHGVTSICVVSIGRGSAGSSSRTGSGGALAYLNAIPCTPGEPLDVIIDSVASSLSRGGTALVSAGAATNTTPGSVIAGTGFPGGQGASDAAGLVRRGAGAGGYTSAGGASGTTAVSNGGGGSNPYGGTVGGVAGAAPGVDGGTYGGGAGKDAGNPTRTGGPGCVRIMWGAGRAFPNTNTGDM